MGEQGCAAIANLALDEAWSLLRWIVSSLADSGNDHNSRKNHEFNGHVMTLLMMVVRIMIVTMTSKMTGAVLITMMD